MTGAQEVIPTSLLKLNSDNANRAVKMFLGIQKFMAEGVDGLPTIQRYEMAQKLLHQVPASSCFCTGGNDPQSRQQSSRAWTLRLLGGPLGLDH